MQLANEEYKVWAGGLWNSFLYDYSVNGDNVLYAFYSGVNFDGSSDDNLLFSMFTKKRGVAVTEDDITDGFAKAISKKIVNDVARGDKWNFLDSLKTLPKQFFTQENCDFILENVWPLSKTLPELNPERLDVACKKFLEGAKKFNPSLEGDFGKDNMQK